MTSFNNLFAFPMVPTKMKIASLCPIPLKTTNHVYVSNHSSIVHQGVLSAGGKMVSGFFKISLQYVHLCILMRRRIVKFSPKTTFDYFSYFPFPTPYNFSMS